MLNVSFTTPKTGNNKVFGGKANFLMTDIHFNNFKAYEDCVGLILFINVSKKTLNIKAVTQEYESIIVDVRSQKVPPGGKGILTYTLKSPEPGKFLSSSLIFFKQFNEPVKINISGNFVTN